MGVYHPPSLAELAMRQIFFNRFDEKYTQPLSSKERDIMWNYISTKNLHHLLGIMAISPTNALKAIEEWAVVWMIMWRSGEDKEGILVDIKSRNFSPIHHQMLQTLWLYALRNIEDEKPRDETRELDVSDMRRLHLENPYPRTICEKRQEKTERELVKSFTRRPILSEARKRRLSHRLDITEELVEDFYKRQRVEIGSDNAH